LLARYVPEIVRGANKQARQTARVIRAATGGADGHAPRGNLPGALLHRGALVRYGGSQLCSWR